MSWSDVLLHARRHALLRYALAVVSVALAVGLVLLARAFMGERGPVYLFFAGAVAVSAAYGGLWPGVLATFLSTIVVLSFLVVPLHSTEITRQGPAYLLLFVAVALLISSVTDALRTAYWRAEELREEAEDARHRIAFLAEASTIFDSSLDYETTLSNVARLVVPSMADWCAIDVLEEDRTVRHLASAHVEPQKEELIRKLQHRYPLNAQGANPLTKVLTTGVPDLYLDIPDSALVATARDAEHLDALRRLGLRSYMCVPLSARGRTLGTILFVSAGRHRYTPADLSLATDLARRAGTAVDNARLYRAASDELAERRRAQDALRLSESRLSGIINSAMDAIISVDAHQRVVVFNEAAERMFGCPGDRAIGQPLDRFIPERFRFAHRDHVGHFGETGDTARSMSSPGALVGLRSDGHEFPIEATISQVETNSEKLYTVIIRDVTERKQAEEEIKELNERLQRSMTETHHRVKNNLQVIAAMVDMRVMDDTEVIPADEFRRLGGHIRALAIVHDILTQESRADARVESVSAKAMLGKLLPLMQQATGGTVTIRDRLDDALLSARQTTSLALVVNELVSNAVKHGRGVVDVTLDVRGSCATLHVMDNGSGFPPDFDPVRAANTGLDLVNSLTQWDLGGRAQFTNRPEGGGDVQVEIHLEEPAAPDAVAA